MKNYILLMALVLTGVVANAQVGIGTTNPYSNLDIPATNPAAPTNTDGILIPRINAFPATNPTVSQNGMMVFLSVDLSGKPKGFYYWDQPSVSWKGIGENTANAWNLTGNSGTNAATNFIGTTDDADIIFKRNNQPAGFIDDENTAFGNRAMLNNSSGTYNTAFGREALRENTTGNLNVAFGASALLVNTTGGNNVGIGTDALNRNVSGNGNVAVGNTNLSYVVSGDNNTAVGQESLSATVGSNNVGIGAYSGTTVTTGSNNVAIGSGSDIQNGTASDQLSIMNVIYGTTMSATNLGKIGVGEKAPDAKLHISSATPANPTFTDGIIIPRVSTLTPPVSMTTAQNGMMVFLTAVFSGNQPGFYYWDSPNTAWKGIAGNATADADFYEVGTTDAPNDNADAMFHTGDVAIGKNTTAAKLDVEETTLNRAAAMRITYNNSTLNASAALRTDMATTATTGVSVSQDNRLTINGGRAINVSNTISGPTNNDVLAVDNDLNTTGNGPRTGTYNLFRGSGSINSGLTNRFSAGNMSTGVNNIFENSPSSISVGVRNNFTDSGTGVKAGMINTIANTGNNFHYGVKNEISSTTTSSAYGIYSELGGATGGNRTGSFASIASEGNGNHYGTFSNITGSGTGEHRGNYTLLEGSGIGLQYASDNRINVSGNGIHRGVYNYIYGSGSGIHYGIFNSMEGGGNGNQYGSYNLVTNTGTGDKYGSYSRITAAIPGIHYGVYSEVLKTTGFAGYFLGQFSIGTTAANSYIMPASRGTVNQVMQTDASGNVSWQSPSGFAWQTTGNSGIDAAVNFIGTTDAADVVFKKANLFAGVLGDSDTAFGSKSLGTYTTGSQSSAFGVSALGGNIGGTKNTAIGFEALKGNTWGSKNIAIGGSALKTQSYANSNTAYDSNNTAIGYEALSANQPINYGAYFGGINNMAVGAEALKRNTIGTDNTALGTQALANNTASAGNVAIGARALYTQSYNHGGMPFGIGNVAIGNEALYMNNPTGSNAHYNVAIGVSAMRSNTVGYQNVALGAYSLFRNTDGYSNVAIGASALTENTTGSRNTGIGVAALRSNAAGELNTAIGISSLSGNKNASRNIAIGESALAQQNYLNGGTVWDTDNLAIGVYALMTNNPTSAFNGYRNSAIGNYSLQNNTTGLGNTAVGFEAGKSNTNGNYNTAMGYQALLNVAGGSSNTAVGSESQRSNVSGANNVSVGNYALYNQIGGSQNTCIGNSVFPTSGTSVNNYTGIGYNVGGAGSVSNMVELGNGFVTAIRAQVTGITSYSDSRIKKNVTENVPGLDFINKLRPVTYNIDLHKQNEILYRNKKYTDVDWEGKYDIEKIKQTGFIAQEVAAAAKATNYDFNGVDIPKNPENLYSVNYTSFVVPLVKAVQEQQQIIEEEKEKNAVLESEIAILKTYQQNLEQRLKAIEDKLNK